ncbi:MAG: DNA-directed RNA polymerase subunit omega [Clostridia bacterium]|nr:DNA-directed RNA polymerase subunit omega [Clostridia bacterium]
MLYPSVQQLTHNGEINRYRLVIATAKCARHINEEMEEERLNAEKHKDQDYAPRADFSTYPVQKPVSIAVQKLAEGDYHILTTDD